MSSLKQKILYASEIIFLMLTVFSLSAVAAQTAGSPSKGKELAAIHTQEQSIQKLRKFLKDHPNDPREPDFLVRLADLYFEKSGISFQYTEGESVKTSKKYYTDALTQASGVLSEMIRKYPSHVSAADAYFKRGKAYKELKQVSLSRADYLKLLATFPTYYRLDSALMDLADYAQEDNHHDEALRYLLQIEKNEASQYYTMALHKAAWSYFNMSNFTCAVRYLKKEILTYQERKSELPYLESAYQDLALFYFEALNKKAGFAEVSDAVSLFQELSQDQVDTQKRPFFGLVIMRFAKLLKAYQLSNDLDQLKAILMKKYDQLPETMEVAMLIYEYHFDRHEYAKLTTLLGEADQIRKNLNQPAISAKYEQAISQSLSQLHELVLKNKKSTELDQLLQPLAQLTDFLRDHLTTKNGTTVLALYAMAETSFSINRFPTATKYYAELLAPEVVLPASLSRSTILLRLVSSRYQELKAINLIQDQLKIVKRDFPQVELNASEKAAVQEWFVWVFDPTTVQNLDSVSFQLEAYKMNYTFLNRNQALNGLEQFAIQNSSLDEARVAAAIVLDTMTASQEWKNIYELSQKILAKKNWKDTKFTEKTQDMSADSHLKITLASSDSSEVLSRTKDCIKQFKNAKILLQCKLIQAKTWVGLKQYSEGEHALVELSKSPLQDDDLKTVVLMKAEVHQKQGKLTLAVQEMEHYLEITKYQDADMAKHVLQIYWFQRNFKKMQPMLSNAKLCASFQNDLCEQYLTAYTVTQGTSTKAYSHVFKQTNKAPKNIVALWALIALDQSQKLPFQDRLVLLQRLSSHWENLDAFFQIQFLDLMKNRVNSTIESIVKSSTSIAPITADESSIEKRMRLLQDMDQTFSKVMKLNWMEIKLSTINQLQIVYQQLRSDLKRIGTPDNLIQPFVKKQIQLTEAAGQLVAMKVQSKDNVNQTTLLDSIVKERIPTAYWEEWTTAVKQQKADYLYYLISLRTEDEYSPLLRGLVLTSLLGDTASTEGYEMIKTAPETSWKQAIAQQGVIK